MHIDLIIESENVFTGTDAATKPAAVATSGDRIVAVGPRADVHAFARTRNEGPAPEVRDFGDALVVPGFHDSHLHFFHSAVYASPLATMFLGENEADCVERMRAFAEQRPSGWLLAQGWREYRWDPPVLPSKRSLDEAFPPAPWRCTRATPTRCGSTRRRWPSWGSRATAFPRRAAPTIATRRAS